MVECTRSPERSNPVPPRTATERERATSIFFGLRKAIAVNQIADTLDLALRSAAGLKELSTPPSSWQGAERRITGLRKLNIPHSCYPPKIESVTDTMEAVIGHTQSEVRDYLDTKLGNGASALISTLIESGVIIAAGTKKIPRNHPKEMRLSNFQHPIPEMEALRQLSLKAARFVPDKNNYIGKGAFQKTHRLDETHVIKYAKEGSAAADISARGHNAVAKALVSKPYITGDVRIEVPPVTRVGTAAVVQKYVAGKPIDLSKPEHISMHKGMRRTLSSAVL